MGKTTMKVLAVAFAVLAVSAMANEDISLDEHDEHFMDYVVSLVDEYAPDNTVKKVVAAAEAKEAKKKAKEAKKVAEKLAIAKETKKQLKKEAEKKTGAAGNEQAKLSIVKTSAKVKILQKEAARQAKIAEKWTLKAKPHELKSKKLTRESKEIAAKNAKMVKEIAKKDVRRARQTARKIKRKAARMANKAQRQAVNVVKEAQAS